MTKEVVEQLKAEPAAPRISEVVSAAVIGKSFKKLRAVIVRTTWGIVLVKATAGERLTKSMIKAKIDDELALQHLGLHVLEAFYK